MSRGSYHRIVGHLRLTTKLGYHLECEGGALWLLDMPFWRPHRYDRQLDYRVEVHGFRTGFNLLDVRRLIPEDLRYWPFRPERFWILTRMFEG